MRSSKPSIYRLFLLAGLLLSINSGGRSAAQEMVPVKTPDGQTVMVPAAQAAAIQAQMAAGGVPGGPPTADAGKKPEGAPADGAAGEKPAEEKAEVAKRGTEPPEPPNPKELEIRPGDDGLIAFSFRNQPWPALIQWYAEIAGKPLDWQELPGDYVNLASPGRYTIEDTRDLFNRHLLARGYTMLDLDGGITVVKTMGINPAIVPRLTPTELMTEARYSFVRTSLDCGWLLATKLAEELKPMISTNGRLVALEQTNRIEAMDAAINIQQIADLLRDEQSAEARDDLAREFELRHIPAEEARGMLSRFLGIAEEEKPAPVSPQMRQQMQMMQQQMMQQNGGQMPQQKKAAEISIVVNSRRNSLLVNAPPDRLAVAAQFIKQIDVASSSLQSLADLESRIQVFRLSSLDPAKLAEIATDMNILEPATKMRVDDKNNALILSGSAADRYIIKTLIERLDGSARKFEVLQLRRLDAQEVTESIMFLMGTEEKEDTSNNRRFMYSYWDSMGGNDDKKDKDKFRVAANARFRQVLLWANESEMSEVRNLLIKLGELPPDGGNKNMVRRIEASATPDTLEYLKRLREQFNTISPNRIELPPSDAFLDPLDQQDGSEPGGADQPSKRIIEAETEEQPALDKDRTTSNSTRRPEVSDTDQWVETYQLVRSPLIQETPGDDNLPDISSGNEFDRLFKPKTKSEPPASNPGAGSPIRIELDEDGNLVLISDDTEALDQLENLMLEVAPPRRPYTIFKVKHASAFWISTSLEEYFEDDGNSGSDENDSFLRFIWDMPPKDEKGPGGLGAKRKLKFVSDTETGSIVVTGATTSQLKTIGELIELWDVPESVSRRQSRFTRLVTVQYSRADQIAATIKDAYRDLLSGNDKAFTQQQPNGGGSPANRGGQRGRSEGGNELVDSEGGKTSGATSFTFKGKLSIGIDTVGNTLLVSTEGDDLLDLVCEMIDKLDQAARPQGGMRIRSVPGTINVEALESAMQFLAPGGSKVRDRTESVTAPPTPAPAAPEPVENGAAFGRKSR